MFKRSQTFCEAMQENPALVLTMLEDLGYVDTSPRQKALAQVREIYELFGAEAAEDAARRHGLDIKFE